MSKRTILITGGTGKFGRALVGHFLSSGDRVAVTSRTDASLIKLYAEYEGEKDRPVGMKAELTDKASIAEILKKLSNNNIIPDCLINCARSIDYLKIEEDGLVSRENFLNEFLLDVVVPYEMTMALVNQDNSKLGKVVNIGSMYGTVAANLRLYSDPGKQSPLHYSVAKAALSHLTKELAVRLAERNVQVNCVAYGGVEGRVDDDFKQRYSELCPMGRMLRDDEIAGPVDMLLSDNSSGVTGHTLAVDGGWSIW